MIRPVRAHSEASVHYYYQQAVMFYKQQHYAKSLEQLVRGLQIDVDYKPFYLLARDIFAKLNGIEERRLFAIALSDFEDFQAFFDLGYHFIDTEHYELAAALLEKALQLEPTNIDAAYELAFAYMARFKIQAALNALKRVNYESDFWAAYLYYQCKLWLNQPEGVADFINDVKALLKNNVIHESSELINDKILELEESLKRYHTLTLSNKKLLRDWHFIQYGGVILHYFEANKSRAGGRYLDLTGTHTLVHLVLSKLVNYLSTLERLPQRILALPDADSIVLGKVLGHLLKIPCEYLEIVEDFTQCLIVAADSRSLNGVEPLIEISPQQTVFAFNHSWLKRSMIVPDVIGVMTQHYESPWAALNLTADSASLDHLVQEILATSISLDAEFKDDLAFYQKQALWLKGGEQGGSKRSPYSIESPVGIE